MPPQESVFARVRREEAARAAADPTGKNPAGAGTPPPPPQEMLGDWDDESVMGDPTMSREDIEAGREITPLINARKHLPAIAGTIGGIVGMGTAPAWAPTAAVGLPIASVLAGLLGGAGRGAQIAMDAREGKISPSMGEDVKDIGLAGVGQGATNYLGGKFFQAAGEGLKNMGRSGMQSAIKIKDEFLKKASVGARKSMDETRKEITEDLLGLHPGSPMNPKAADRMVEWDAARKAEYDRLIRAAPNVPMQGENAAVQSALQAQLRGAAQGSAPQKNMRAVERLMKDINTSPSRTTQMPGPPVTRQVQSPILGPNGQPVTTTVTSPGPLVRVPKDLTPLESQATGAADNASMRGLNQRGEDARANATKAVMGVTKSFRDRVAGTKEVTDLMRRGINMEKVGEAARKRASNTNPFGLTDVAATGVSAVSGNPAPMIVSLGMKPRPMAAMSRGAYQLGNKVAAPTEVQDFLRRLALGEISQKATAPYEVPPDDEEW